MCRYKSNEAKKKLLEESKDPSTPSSPCVNGDTYVSKKQSEKLANYQCRPIDTVHQKLLLRYVFKKIIKYSVNIIIKNLKLQKVKIKFSPFNYSHF